MGCYYRVACDDEDLKQVIEFWENNPNICTSETCPIKHIHNEGRYLYHGWFAYNSHYFFGSNNPPPLIWSALHRIDNETEQGSAIDEDVALGFFENHVLVVYDDYGEEVLV